MMAARMGLPLWYQAPMDARPTRLGGSVQYKIRKTTIRIIPPKHDADPFTADKGHLDRFRWDLSALEGALRK